MSLKKELIDKQARFWVLMAQGLAARINGPQPDECRGFRSSTALSCHRRVQ